MAAATANGLVLFDSAGAIRQVLGRREGLIADQVTDVAFSGNTLIAATPAGLSFVDSQGIRRIDALQGLVNNHVYSVASDGQHLMAGTLGGVSVIQGDRVRASYTTANSRLRHNWITALAKVDSEWFAGTYGAGVLALEPGWGVAWLLRPQTWVRGESQRARRRCNAGLRRQPGRRTLRL